MNLPVTRFDTGQDEYSSPNVIAFHTRLDGLPYDTLQILADGTIKQGDGTAPPAVFTGGGGGGAVSSVNTQVGAVVLAAGDIAVTPVGALAAVTVQGAVTELDADLTTEISARTTADSNHAAVVNGTVHGINNLISTAIANLVNSSPAALDTLSELATALGNDAAFATTVTTSIGLRALRSNNLSDLASFPLARYNMHDQVLAACRVVATANVASKSGTTTIDGILLAAGDTVLLTAQTTIAENGPWVVAAGAWTRAADYPTGGTVISRIVHVVAGTVYAGTIWTSLTTSAVTIDTTGHFWVLAGKAYNDARYMLATASMGGFTITASKTANYTAVSGDLIPCNANGGAFTVTLPAASTANRTVCIKKTDSSANGVTIARAGADTIDGATSIILTTQYNAITLQSDGGTAWHII